MVASIIFTSLPIMPSDYRPLTFIFAAPLAILFFIKRHSLRVSELTIVGTLCFFLLYGVLLGATQGNRDALRGAAPIIIGLICYLGLLELFRNTSSEKILSYLVATTLILCTLTTIEALSIYGIIPYKIKDSIAQIFANGHLVSRLQGTTHEASWLARLLAFFIPFNLLALKQRTPKSKAALTLTVATLLLTFSLDGYFIAIISYSAYLLINFKKALAAKKLLKTAAISIVAGLVFLPILSQTTNAFDEDSYFIQRFNKAIDLASLDMDFIAYQIDGSIFIRLMYPIAGFKMFQDHPFGTGLGGYSENFKDYISAEYEKTPWRIPEVDDDIQSKTGDPKSLYSRIASELGILGIIAILTVILTSRAETKRIPDTKERNLYFLIFVSALASGLQFASFASVTLWFSFAFLSTYSRQTLKQ